MNEVGAGAHPSEQEGVKAVEVHTDGCKRKRAFENHQWLQSKRVLFLFGRHGLEEPLPLVRKTGGEARFAGRNGLGGRLWLARVTKGEERCGGYKCWARRVAEH